MNRPLVTALAAAALAAGLAGCRGEVSDKPPRQFFPGLDDQPKYKAQTRSTFFAEHIDEETGEVYGRAAREPVPGTVAYGRTWHTSPVAGIDFAERATFLRDDDRFFLGKEPDGSWVEYMPVAVDDRLLAIGKEQYEINCLVCHGGTGKGDGLVGRRWSYPLPSYHTEQYYHGGEKGADGYLFHSLRNGVPNVGGSYEYKMRPYGDRLTIEESWAIVAYIRVLQEAERGTLQDLPARERRELEQRRGLPAANPQPESNDQEPQA